MLKMEDEGGLRLFDEDQLRCNESIMREEDTSLDDLMLKPQPLSLGTP